jgi:hypothetical protein
MICVTVLTLGTSYCNVGLEAYILALGALSSAAGVSLVKENGWLKGLKKGP